MSTKWIESLLDYEPQPWADDALCAKLGDPSLADAWFPNAGSHTAVEVKKMCGQCPVRIQCLEYALAHDEKHGIWGGLSRIERRTLQRQRRQQGAA
jgi:WhiB family redox-sensing transcriptional regulator